MTITTGPRVADRAAALLDAASLEVAGAWRVVRQTAEGDLPEMGLAAGDRPCADAEVLASLAASAEYLLACRLHAAAAAGSIPFGGAAALLTARGWSTGVARRLVRCGALAARYPSVAAVWAGGVVTAEHVDSVAKAVDRFSAEEVAAILVELEPHWGAWSPGAIARFVEAAHRMLHPKPDPAPGEADAYDSRHLSFGILGDTVVLTGSLPRVEGELVIAAIDAFAERLRSTADQVPAAARRADALVELVNTAHATGGLPSRGGLPVSLTVTLEHTSAGDPLCTTSRGHQLSDSEIRWAACDPAITPIAVRRYGCPDDLGTGAEGGGPGVQESPTARIAALAVVMFGAREVLAAGRSQRTATAGQRRALAIRDKGCVIPGCGIPAEACQVHHLAEWADGGSTDLENLCLLCWAHHRQVDLRMWELEPTHAPPEPPRPTGALPTLGSAWPGNHGAPFTIRRTPRTRWRN